MCERDKVSTQESLNHANQLSICFMYCIRRLRALAVVRAEWRNAKDEARLRVSSRVENRIPTISDLSTLVCSSDSVQLCSLETYESHRFACLAGTRPRSCPSSGVASAWRARWRRSSAARPSSSTRRRSRPAGALGGPAVGRLDAAAAPLRRSRTKHAIAPAIADQRRASLRSAMLAGLDASSD